MKSTSTSRNVFKRVIALSMLAALMALVACTGNIDWTGVSFPCSESRACATGFTCQAGVCVDPNGTEPPKAKIKVGFLYVGPIGDFGWTWAHEQGRLYLEKIGYETTFAGPVGPSDTAKNFDDFKAKGFNLLIGTSHDFLTPILSYASKNADLQHLACSGFETGSNVGSYFGRLYQAEWLAGMIAGATTKTNRVGFLATVAIPELARHINAFTNGVRFTNPKADVIVKWVGNWFDPKKEPILTRELLDLNADVIHSHTDTSIPLEMIENKDGEPLTTKDGSKVYTIGLNSVNACEFGPRTCLTTVYWNWGPMLERIIKQMEAGTWDPKKALWESIKSDKNSSSFHLSSFSKLIAGTTRVQVESLIPKLAKEGIEGQQLPFEGPLNDSEGKQRLAKGKYLADKDLLNMCWYVAGVVDGYDQEGKAIPGVVPSGCRGDR